MNDENLIKENICLFLEHYFNVHEVSFDENIFENGLINSLFFMQLLQYLESEYNIEMDFNDMVIDNFSSINNIIKFVKQKLHKE
jgi:acyl carrier protein